MSRTALTRFSLALPAVMLAQGAFADVSAQQVWGDWKQYMQNFGYQITATETVNGDNVEVSDLSVAMTLPENEGDFTMVIGTMSFVQNGADVDIMLPETVPLAIDITPSGSEPPMSMKFDVIQNGHSIKVTGTPEDTTYVQTASTFSMEMTEFQVDGDTLGPDNAKLRLSGTDMTNTTNMKKGDMRVYTQSGSMATLDYDIRVDNPAEQVKFEFIGGTTDVSFDGGGAIPLEMINANDMAALLRAGFAVNGVFNYGAGQTQIMLQDQASGDFAATTSSDGGALGVEMNANTLAYTGEQNNVKMSVKAATLPFPVEMSMAKGAFNLGMPIAASDEAQDFAFGFTLGDFVMSDLLWSIFDPTAQLPRDPATIDLGLTGKAKLLIDIMDPAATASAAAPGELQALTIDKLLVSAAGARVAGTGDVTFDNTDLATFDGFPKPVGAVNIDVAGANGLMDKLVAMGLLPEQQAMGARMMMGLFAVPGDAPDTLKSKVEFTPEGQVLANGQRIK